MHSNSLRSLPWSAGVMLLAAAVLLGGCAEGKWSIAQGPGWISLFDGKDLAGWKGTAPPDANKWQVAEAVSLDAANPKRFLITPGTGIMVNGSDGRTCDLVTDKEFGDCQLHIEFVVSKGSNSGVYLQGNYEIQILDSHGKKDFTFGDCGGIYARWIDEKNVEGHAPRVNASKPPGEWQSFDVTFRAPRFDASGKKIENARFVKVLLNGALIHENVELNGPTRGSMSPTDTACGPLRLQGDHGPVAFRKIRVRPQ